MNPNADKLWPGPRWSLAVLLALLGMLGPFSIDTYIPAYAGIAKSLGATPVQNIGAYGVELQDRFDSLDAIDLQTGQLFTLDAAQCGFGYRDSVFKHAAGDKGLGLKDRALILRPSSVCSSSRVNSACALSCARCLRCAYSVAESASYRMATASFFMSGRRHSSSDAHV